MGDCVSREIDLADRRPTALKQHPASGNTALVEDEPKYRNGCLTEEELAKSDSVLSRLIDDQRSWLQPRVQDDDETSVGSSAFNSCTSQSEEEYCESSDWPDEDQPSTQDLSGNWRFSGFEGDFDDLMIDAGVAWTIRRAARAVNYGVGTVVHSIMHSGDSVVIEVRMSYLGGHRMKFQIGAGEQETFAEDGTRVVANPQWDHGALLVSAYVANDGGFVQPLRWYLLDIDLMAIESTTSKGTVVRRFFKRC